MHVVIATMSHETNTFSPVVTNLARFSGGRAEPMGGEDAERVYAGTASCVGGFLQAVTEDGQAPITDARRLANGLAVLVLRGPVEHGLDQVLFTALGVLGLEHGDFNTGTGGRPGTSP